MAKGRKATPTEQKIIKGDFGKRGIEKGLPEFSTLVDLTPPDHLHPFARAAWQYIAPELKGKGCLTIMDVALLEAFCVAYAEFRINKALIKLHGRTYWAETRNGKQQKRRQEVTQMHEAINQMRSLGSEFGLSPASRGRLQGMAQLGFDFMGGSSEARDWAQEFGN